MKLAALRLHVALWGLRAAWALALALWALALVPWFRDPPPPAPGATPRTAAVAAQPAPRLPYEEIIEPSTPAPLAQRERSASAVDAAPAAPAERGVRDGATCGLADATGVAVEAPSPAQKAGYFARQAMLGLPPVVEALRLRAEPSAHAAGHWLRVLQVREGAADVQAAAAACPPGSDCAGVAAPATAPPPVAAAADALAQLAQASSDAWVMQIAQRACDGVLPPPAACTSLGTRRWSVQEPDNAAAWVELAARDPQAVDEALFRAAKASRFDGHRGRLAAWVLQATPEQLPAMQRYAAWQRSDEWERAADARTLAAAVRACSDAARRDANRDQLCDGAVRWLATNVRAPPAAEATAAAAGRTLDCATIERQWREARDSAQRGARVATSTPRR
ncbi:MAG TPA: hypothetical protein VI032_08095 [Burkholderiaceae bacterium]